MLPTPMRAALILSLGEGAGEAAEVRIARVFAAAGAAAPARDSETNLRRGIGFITYHLELRDRGCP